MSVKSITYNNTTVNLHVAKFILSFLVFLSVFVAVHHLFATHIVMPASRGEPVAQCTKALPKGFLWEKYHKVY